MILTVFYKLYISITMRNGDIILQCGLSCITCKHWRNSYPVATLCRKLFKRVLSPCQRLSPLLHQFQPTMI